VETDQALWAETYERDFQDLLVLQSEVAQAVAREIEIAVSPEEAARLASARPVNPEAHDAYLKGFFHSEKLTGADLDTALSYFELALEKDPDYAPAYAGIARVWSIRRSTGYASPREANPKTKAGLLKALELDESLAEAHFGLAYYKIFGEWDWPSGERAFVRAFELNPNHAEGRAHYSRFLHFMGRPDEAMVQIERALELDPFNDLLQTLYGVNLKYLRRYDEAIEQFRSALRTAPGSAVALSQLSGTLHLKGMYEESLEVWRSILATRGDREGEEALTRGYKEAGYAGAMRRLAETRAARSRRTGRGTMSVVGLYNRIGENELALDWLERAFEERNANLPSIGVAPGFDSLRDHPRFQDLLRRMNLPE